MNIDGMITPEGATYWKNMSDYKSLDALLLPENKVELPIFCACGNTNEWIGINDVASFWGCKPCYHKKMKSLIKLVKPEG